MRTFLLSNYGAEYFRAITMPPKKMSRKKPVSFHANQLLTAIPTDIYFTYKSTVNMHKRYKSNAIKNSKIEFKVFI